MRTIDVPIRDLSVLAASLDDIAARRLRDGARQAQADLADRRLIVVSAASSAHPGLTDGVLGVTQLLHSLLPTVAGAGLDVRWFALDTLHDHAVIAQRLHDMLHGDRGDGGRLGPAEHEAYTDALAADAAELAELLRPGDVVILHDPATAGLALRAAEAGARVVWRCHLGQDVSDETSETAWAFLEPYLQAADAVVVSRRVYAPPYLDNVVVITPSVDLGAPKNVDLDTRTVRDVVRLAGVVGGHTDLDELAASFTRSDGTEALVRTGSCDLVAGDPVPEGARIVLQVGRWDRLKDPTGLLIAWQEGIDRLPDDAHLVLAGPSVTDRRSPAGQVLESCRDLWGRLDPEVRDRSHVVTLPADDAEENAIIVNALQRHASVVVQKSLAEGWGLTVTEAMAKGRPVVASAVGGIQDQITHGEDGVLLRDPVDLAVFVDEVADLLDDERRAAALGAAAELRVRRDHLGDRHLLAWADLMAGLG